MNCHAIHSIEEWVFLIIDVVRHESSSVEPVSCHPGIEISVVEVEPGANDRATALVGEKDGVVFEGLDDDAVLYIVQNVLGLHKIHFTRFTPHRVLY